MDTAAGMSLSTRRHCSGSDDPTANSPRRIVSRPRSASRSLPLMPAHTSHLLSTVGCTSPLSRHYRAVRCSGRLQPSRSIIHSPARRTNQPHQPKLRLPTLPLGWDEKDDAQSIGSWMSSRVSVLEHVCVLFYVHSGVSSDLSLGLFCFSHRLSFFDHHSAAHPQCTAGATQRQHRDMAWIRMTMAECGQGTGSTTDADTKRRTGEVTVVAADLQAAAAALESMISTQRRRRDHRDNIIAHVSPYDCNDWTR